MSVASCFEFFEVIVDELCGGSPLVITAESLKSKGYDSSLLDELQRSLHARDHNDAIRLSVDMLKAHFSSRNSELPFQFDKFTNQFAATDSDYLEFVRDMIKIRSLGKHSRDFECRVAERIGVRATGSIHRVGHPRDRLKSKADFNSHLRTLGFQRPVLLGQEKDGGLDILWQLPLGAVSHRPFVSVQCKNGKLDLKSAYSSIGTGSTSLSQHGGLQQTVHVPCVLFNDYVYPERLTTKQLGFVPLGLSDLASIKRDASVEFI